MRTDSITTVSLLLIRITEHYFRESVDRSANSSIESDRVWGMSDSVKLCSPFNHLSNRIVVTPKIGLKKVHWCYRETQFPSNRII